MLFSSGSGIAAGRGVTRGGLCEVGAPPGQHIQVGFRFKGESSGSPMSWSNRVG